MIKVLKFIGLIFLFIVVFLAANVVTKEEVRIQMELHRVF